MIAVQGSIQTRSYEDKNGNKRTATEIIADNVSFCGSRNSDNGSQNRFEAPAQNTPAYQSDDTSAFQNITPDEDFGFGSAADDEDGLPF
jgi:single-strand DNA-binding protein